MESVVFNGHAGWLHAAAGDCGVVLCNPFGHEAMWLYQGMRRLADYLAESGVSVLRFDYLGTGDSADVEGYLRPTEWAAEVVEAVAYLKSVTGVERVSLAGFRFGAAVAVLAAQRVEIDSIAMFAPVVSMGVFMREMRILNQTWRDRSHLPDNDMSTPEGACDILGHRFSVAGLDALRGLNLSINEHLPARRILVAHSGMRDGSDNLVAHLQAQGAQVDSITFENYLQVMQPPWLTECPDATLRTAADWLSKGCALRVPPPSTSTRDDMRVAIDIPGATEYPLQVGDGRLFGVLCEPTQSRFPLAQSPVLLIANTAATHRAGDGRFGIELARRIAQLGYASLRIDADGIGDSQGGAKLDIPGHIALDSIAADLSQSADWLAARGYRHVAIFGICAGAYAGLNAALNNPVVRGLTLVNPASFLLPDGCTFQEAALVPRGSPRAHLRSMVRATKWSQVIRGNVRLAPVARTMWRHAVAQMAGLVAAWSNEKLCSTTLSHQVLTRFRQLDTAGVHILLLFSPQDHALDEFYMHFGLSGQQLRKLKRVHAHIFRNMDHEVLDRQGREQVIVACHALLEEVSHAALADEARRSPAERLTDTTAASHDALKLDVHITSKLSGAGK